MTHICSILNSNRQTTANARKWMSDIFLDAITYSYRKLIPDLGNIYIIYI